MGVRSQRTTRQRSSQQVSAVADPTTLLAPGRPGYHAFRDQQLIARRACAGYVNAVRKVRADRLR